MTSYNFGDIVPIGFPHTDLQGTSKRPAIVLYDSGDQDVLLARITTQEYTIETDYRVLDWQKSGLLAESYIRLGFNKILYGARRRAYGVDFEKFI